jgi:hypothetical protein
MGVTTRNIREGEIKEFSATITVPKQTFVPQTRNSQNNLLVPIPHPILFGFVVSRWTGSFVDAGLYLQIVSLLTRVYLYCFIYNIL